MIITTILAGLGTTRHGIRAIFGPKTAQNPDRGARFSRCSFSKSKRDINIRSSPGENYSFSPLNLRVVIADSAFQF